MGDLEEKYGRADSKSSEDEKVEKPSAKQALLSGGYNQIYAILKSDNLISDSKSAESINEVFFRCGNWCYKGNVQFNGLNIGLSDLPVIIPTLQRQQGSLRYYCNSTRLFFFIILFFSFILNLFNSHF